MTLNEFAVLDALNIASVRQGGPGDYWGTADGVADVLADDPRFEGYPKLSARQVGYVLRHCAHGHPRRRDALVKKAGRRHGGALKWRLTDAACSALIA